MCDCIWCVVLWCLRTLSTHLTSTTLVKMGLNSSCCSRSTYHNTHRHTHPFIYKPPKSTPRHWPTPPPETLCLPCSSLLSPTCSSRPMSSFRWLCEASRSLCPLHCSPRPLRPGRPPRDVRPYTTHTDRQSEPLPLPLRTVCHRTERGQKGHDSPLARVGFDMFTLCAFFWGAFCVSG